VQGLVGELFRCAYAFAAEIGRQPPAHLEILLAAGVDTFVEPRKQAAERVGTRLPALLQLEPCDQSSSLDSRGFYTPRRTGSRGSRHRIASSIASARRSAGHGFISTAAAPTR